nr:T9SS type A sorting domain-containing protein [uncultured Fluviicola sp.]
MNKIVTLILTLSILQLTAQGTYRLTFQFNNTSCLISSDGIFFKDQANGLATYRVPKNGQVTSIYQMSFSASAKDQNNQDHFSVTTYDSSDFRCGPLAADYSDSNYINKFGNIMWTMTQSQIDLHIQNWNTGSYVVPPTIAQWPGNGIVSNGMATQLAPYTDVNGNGTYDPVNGDYPNILGDIAVFMMMNDQNNSKFPATSPLNMELHFMFYQYATNNALNNTTFVNVKAYNRSNQTFTDLKFNVFTDFDLGNYTDDFGGTDLARNLAYVYNGDNTDENINGFTGFGANPPAIGLLSLNHPLITSVFPDSIPHPNNEFLNVINGKQADGSVFMNTGTPTVLQYTDTLSTGYNELALNHAPSDRRNFSTISLGTFAPNSLKCMDFAWVYARKMTGTSLLKSVDSLMKVADFIQDFYDNTNYCTDGMLQTTQLELTQFNLYPNPSNGMVTCTADQNLESVEVWNMEGRLICKVQAHEKEMNLDLSQLTAGAYLIKLLTGSETKTMPFLKH